MKRKCSAVTQAKVLDAARLTFEAFSYEAATIRLIASLTGMTTGAIYAHYSGKEEIYREVYGHDPITPEMGRELLAALAGAPIPVWARPLLMKARAA